MGIDGADSFPAEPPVRAVPIEKIIGVVQIMSSLAQHRTGILTADRPGRRLKLWPGKERAYHGNPADTASENSSFKLTQKKADIPLIGISAESAKSYIPTLALSKSGSLVGTVSALSQPASANSLFS